MLDEGAGSRSALELADALEFLGANLSTTSSFDYSAVRLSVPVEAGDALPLMSDVALRPTFPAGDLDRLRKERLTGLLQARDNPGGADSAGVSARRLRPDASLRHLGERIAAGDRGFTVADLQAFYRAHYRPDNATLLVVGDVTPASVMPMLEKAFGIVEERGHGAARRRRAERAAAQVAPGLHRRQAGCAAVADPHRLGRRAALDGRLRGARGAEHDSRRIVYVAAEPEPARGARLQLRRELHVRHAAVGGSVLSPPPACRPTRPARR